MITLALLQLLADNGFGQIDVDLFWQKLSLGKKGIYIVDIGQPQYRGQRKVQKFELYSRGKNDADGYVQLYNVIRFLNDSYEVCKLPQVPFDIEFFVLDRSRLDEETAPKFENVTIMPMGTPSNIGEDTNGRIIWSVSGEIRY